MHLIIDGEVRIGQKENDLRELQQEIARVQNGGRFVQSVTCDSQEVNLADLIAGLVSLDAVAQVEVITCTLDQLIESTLESAYEYLPRLYSAWKGTVEFWRIGEWARGTEQFVSTIPGLQWNLSVLSNIRSLGPEDSEIAIISRKGQAVVPELLDALQNKDFIHLADILEYEALPWLDQWFALIDLFRHQMKLEHLKAGMI